MEKDSRLRGNDRRSMNIIIESAIQLDKDQQAEIEKALKSHGSSFEYRVNPSILGGLRVTMGGRRVDATLLGKVESIAVALQ